uniref:RRM domain-containing protein n=1 Tax=Daucus carota subsp. sativus TaxID=79200 RepID=A0A162A0M9_DAUCS|nr:PREDICTED: flowering time control protein FPA-like [Daucus carota subsp. sativus]
MSGRGERERSRRDYVTRSDEWSHLGGRRNAPPSRHLWVGSLAHNLSEGTLRKHLQRFGELESVAFQPGRGYAFVNYKYKEDAFAAIRGLQGCFVAGDRLKIEFAKSEKSSSSSVDTNLEPSEVLWIGFPAVLKVDETILRNAFSLFGEIVNITAFPGRGYAFVRFGSLRSACRAKDTLLGNLFGDPRVHICFAKSEYTSRGRNPVEAPSSPDIRPFSRIEASHEKLRHNKRSYENISRVPKLAPPRFITDMESQDPDLVLFQRKGNEKPIIDGASERGFQDLGPELRPPRSVYEHQSSPPRDRGAHFRDYSQLDIPRQGQLYDNAWNLPEDPTLFHESKKPKISFFPHENELPEYYFCDPERVKRELPKIPDYHQLDAYNKNFCYGSFGHEQIPDRAINEKQPFGERSEHWNKPSNGFQTRPVPFPPNHVKWKRPSEELNEPSPNEVWEWEGTIAKRGTPVCRARCSPVGKLLDIILPDFLDCTTKTDIDILAKHYYESVSSWVVTFFPYSDADIASYNELMNYLGKKQKAAVAKIDENTTLFLVPPSEFSDEVLKVPGKLGISGVILRSENLGPSIQSLHNPIERNDTSYGSSSVAPFSDQGNLGVQNVHFLAKFPTPQPASFEGPDHIARSLELHLPPLMITGICISITHHRVQNGWQAIWKPTMLVLETEQHNHSALPSILSAENTTLQQCHVMRTTHQGFLGPLLLEALTLPMKHHHLRLQLSDQNNLRSWQHLFLGN